jgi:hypothetical protein
VTRRAIDSASAAATGANGIAIAERAYGAAGIRGKAWQEIRTKRIHETHARRRR